VNPLELHPKLPHDPSRRLAAGFVAGMLAMWIPYFGLSKAGVGALTVVGALVGTWVSMLVGLALPDDIRRTFAREIEAGKVLVVVDAEQEDFGSVESAIAAAGGARLPYESTTALTCFAGRGGVSSAAKGCWFSCP